MQLSPPAPRFTFCRLRIAGRKPAVQNLGLQAHIFLPCTLRAIFHLHIAGRKPAMQNLALHTNTGTATLV